MTQVEYVSAQSVHVYSVLIHSVPVHSVPVHPEPEQFVPGKYVWDSLFCTIIRPLGSVADPDPYFFGPPGSVSDR